MHRRQYVVCVIIFQVHDERDEDPDDPVFMFLFSFCVIMYLVFFLNLP